ncbi:MAG: rod-binding protein [bacterium]|nr:rod-binding protein [bacterium]
MSGIPLPASADIAMHQARQAQVAQPNTKSDAKIEKSAQEFEAMFMGEMTTIMFEGVGDDPMFGGGNGEKMFRSLLTQEYGKAMAAGTGTGIATEMKKMMLQIQEQQQKG